MQICGFYNKIIKLQYFPREWKEARVVPVPKSGKEKGLVGSYRPISLLPTMSKVIEKLILNKMTEHVEEAGTLHDRQIGSCKRHGTGHAVARLVTNLQLAASNGYVVRAVAIDTEKAFDRVWHEGIIYKIIKNGFLSVLTKLIHSYLSNRSFKVKLKNNYLTERVVAAGCHKAPASAPPSTTYTSPTPRYEGARRRSSTPTMLLRTRKAAT